MESRRASAARASSLLVCRQRVYRIHLSVQFQTVRSLVHRAAEIAILRILSCQLCSCVLTIRTMSLDYIPCNVSFAESKAEMCMVWCGDSSGEESGQENLFWVLKEAQQSRGSHQGTTLLAAAPLVTPDDAAGAEAAVTVAIRGACLGSGTKSRRKG